MKKTFRGRERKKDLVPRSKEKCKKGKPRPRSYQIGEGEERKDSWD